jgi:hypothetical protein
MIKLLSERRSAIETELAALFLSGVRGIISETVPVRVTVVSRGVSFLAVLVLVIVIQGHWLIREHGVDVGNVQIVLNLRLEWRLEL